MRKISILALALSVLAVSCNKEADKAGPGGAEAGAITVTARVNNVTKAVTTGNVTTFEYGDQLTLYVWTGDNTAVPANPWIDGEVVTYDKDTQLWEPKNLMLWKNMTDAHYFLGVYPARAITNFTADQFEQNLDPAAKYDVNDLLVATELSGIKAQDTKSVDLAFDHLMAKFNVSVRFRSQWGSIPEKVEVSIKGAATGTVDYISKTITPGNDVTKMPVVWRSTDLQDRVTYYCSYVIPQTGITEVVVNVEGSEYIYTNPTDIPFVKGHATTLPLIVGKDTIELADEGITIEGWNDGELPDGLGTDAVVAPKIIDLSTLKSDYVVQDGYIVTGTLDANVKISIADGATVILDNAAISYSSKGADWAGLTLIGDGTIQLADGTTNTAIGGLDNGGYSNCPGIFVPEGKTLTINGDTGVLIAACGDGNPDGQGAGIGASWFTNCGNIVINGGVISASGGNRGAGIGGSGRRNCGYITINGGTVTATGHEGAPGIGIGGAKQSTYADGGTCGDITITGGTVIATGGKWGAGIGAGCAFNSKDVTVTKTCGNILISGGTVTATGGEHAAGIGTGEAEDGKGIINIGTITITDGVTLLTATKGEGAPNSIGKGTGTNITCGTVTIGGVVGAITDSPYVYPLPYPIDISEVTSAYVGSVISAQSAKVYKTVADAIADGENPVAIIAYVGAAGSVEESDANFKGLAIALSDADGDMCTWADGNDGLYYCLSSGVDVDLDAALKLINGKTCTETLNNPYHTDHNHVAASFAKENKDTPRPDAASDWFLPSMGQWNLIVQGLATKKAGSAVTTDLTKSNNDTYKASNLNSVITAAGGEGFKEYDYWSSTEYDDVGAWVIKLGPGKAAKYAKASDSYVRSVIAF